LLCQHAEAQATESLIVNDPCSGDSARGSGCKAPTGSTLPVPLRRNQNPGRLNNQLHAQQYDDPSQHVDRTVHVARTLHVGPPQRADPAPSDHYSQQPTTDGRSQHSDNPSWQIDSTSPQFNLSKSDDRPGNYPIRLRCQHVEVPDAASLIDDDTSIDSDSGSGHKATTSPTTHVPLRREPNPNSLNKPRNAQPYDDTSYIKAKLFLLF
jgi:hypothetical protein